ncbi:hypothetical protein ILUMI_06424 [Ignelater luminosus]|uniref:transketolase n=1 Tax=Ignelater luminosus TaxID=2038154 RepID=A0A8K0GHS2_IGNLU|nr:hypothetical protein ILUMI_06424 [Ignelater luminosus]
MPNDTKLDEDLIEKLQDIANKLRIHSVTSTQTSKSGHPTSCSSIADIIAVLFFYTMRYKVKEPKDVSNDRFVLSKGHAAPILYAAWAEAGLFPVEKLKTLRKLDSDLEGHPTPRLNFIDVATGSLGQGLAVAAGMAFVGKHYDRAPYRVYCLIGDGEAAEGSIWESINFAGYYNLSNLCAIFDINRLGQSQTTCLSHNLEVYQKRLEAFGWKAIAIDGHNIEEIANAFNTAATIEEQPTALIAKTLKGKNFPNIEDHENWHGKPLGEHTEEVINHLNSLLKNHDTSQLHPREPITSHIPSVDISQIKLISPPSYEEHDTVATRYAYGTALAKIAQNNSRVVAFDADMKNSTYSEKIKEVDPSRLVECFVAEQNLVGVAIGAMCRNRTVAFVSTFAAFFSRAFDQIRMGAISQTNVNFVGSHCGISVGKDGPSQMGLEDIAMFRSIPGSTVFYPSDAIACERAVELAANTAGVCYIRTTRPKTDIVYSNDHEFHIGKANILKKSSTDKVLLISAGITLFEVLKAASELDKMEINVRVMDLFTIKPIDDRSIIKNAQEVGGRIVTVEDHYPEGGLGEAVLSAVAEERSVIVRKMAVPTLPRSGSPNDLLDHYGISANHIVKTAKLILTL